MQVYYINKKIRILSDTYNFIPEVFCKGKTRVKNEEGKLEIVKNEEEKWRRLGYFSTMEGAINGLLKVIPVVIGDSEDKTKESLKEFLKILINLKKSIKVEIQKGITENDLHDTDLEEEVETKKRKRTKKQ